MTRPWVQAAIVAAISVASYALIALVVPVEVTKTNDIPHIWLEGVRIAHGVNPYAAIAASDHVHVDQYFAVYPPGFYLFCTLTFFLGVTSFDAFLPAWWYAILALHVGASALVGFTVWRRHHFVTALAVMACLTFNRWALLMLGVAALDLLVVPLITAALVLWERNRRAALVLIGVTLALKHVAILLLPLLLVWLWREDRRRRELAISAALLFGPVVIVSLPFLAWGFGDFFWSIALQGTRAGMDEFHAPTIDHWLGVDGVAARLPFFLVAALAAWLSFKGYVARMSSVAIVFVAHVLLAPVMFSQYIYWLAAFVPLIALDLKKHAA